jgi:hypothetical protein
LLIVLRSCPHGQNCVLSTCLYFLIPICQ